ncbi:unnamed protein product [Protopolystoma xenopodis]|uniref:Uncharacterized protein n=1 Tax=Protopolystoma xenopodis TaxID=117903 RepID=A0A448X3I0_9PLAT|nr:unnamed protein product [Protopolystoma xenopodis]
MMIKPENAVAVGAKSRHGRKTCLIISSRPVMLGQKFRFPREDKQSVRARLPRLHCVGSLAGAEVTVQRNMHFVDEVDEKVVDELLKKGTAVSETRRQSEKDARKWVLNRDRNMLNLPAIRLDSRMIVYERISP